MANLKLNNAVVVTESAGVATIQSGIFKAKDGTAAFTVADSTGAATFTGATTLSSTLGVTGATTLSSTLGVTGAATFSGDIKGGTIKAADGTAAITIANSTGAVTLAGDLTVSGTTTTVDTALTVSDATIINNAGSDVGLKINSTSTGHIMQLQDNGTDVLVVKDGGNVGVGTATPTNALLEVVTDNENIARFDGLQGNIDFRYGSDIEFDRAGIVYITANNAAGELQLRTGGQNARLHIDSSGNVGIGDTDPTSKLTIAPNEVLLLRDGASGNYSGLRYDAAGNETLIMSVKNTASKIMFDVGHDIVANQGSGGYAPSAPELTVSAAKVGILTASPNGLFHIRGTNAGNGSSTHGAEDPIRLIEGSNGTTVKEWVHSTRTAVSPSHTTMYSWYKLFSPGGYSSAGTPGIWKLGCHISGCHASNSLYQEYIIVQNNPHGNVGNTGGAEGSVVSQRCSLATSGAAYGAGLTISVWYVSNNVGNNNATFYVRAVHNAREPTFTMHATYIGGTGHTPGGHPQHFAFLGTQTNNNHQPSNLTNLY
jgi:hypothetical protein